MEVLKTYLHHSLLARTEVEVSVVNCSVSTLPCMSLSTLGVLGRSGVGGRSISQPLYSDSALLCGLGSGNVRSLGSEWLPVVIWSGVNLAPLSTGSSCSQVLEASHLVGSGRYGVSYRDEL